MWEEQRSNSDGFYAGITSCGPKSRRILVTQDGYEVPVREDQVTKALDRDWEDGTIVWFRWDSHEATEVIPAMRKGCRLRPLEPTNEEMDQPSQGVHPTGETLVSE